MSCLAVQLGALLLSPPGQGPSFNTAPLVIPGISRLIDRTFG